MIELAKRGAEIGILYTFDPEKRNRYPRRPWIMETLKVIGRCCSVHVCGSRGRGELMAGEIDGILEKVNRFQVNGSLLARDLECLCKRYPRHTVITQGTAKNSKLVEVECDNHAILVDGSGGRGILPGEWVRPDTDKPVGFAGGLGPITLGKELPKIAKVAKGNWWIDMEVSLRDRDDWFSFDLAKVCIGLLNVWNSLFPFQKEQLKDIQGD